jgi:hypothetical protein
MNTGKWLHGKLSWRPAKDKTAEVEMMITAMEKLMAMPEWALYEKYLSMEIMAAMQGAVSSTSQTGVSEMLGRRDGLLRAARALERMKAGKEFVESLTQKEPVQWLTH